MEMEMEIALEGRANTGASQGHERWPKDCPVTCPGVFGEGCGEPVVFLGHFYACRKHPECAFRWENVKTGRDCEFAISFVLHDASTFKVELISPVPYKISSLLEGVEAELYKAGIAMRVRTEYFAIFSLDHYERVIHILARNNVKVLGKHLIPSSTLSAVRRANFKQKKGKEEQVKEEEEVERRYAKMPKDLREKLLPFQVQGVQFGIRKECRMLFADDMGVGKTVQAIALASCYEDSWPLIIVVPASLRLSWVNELEKWLPGLLPSDIHVIFSSDDKLSLRQSHLHASSLSSSSASASASSSKKPKPPLPKVTIISFKMLEILCDEIMECGFGIMIVDESHNIRTTSKRAECKQTEAAAKLIKRTPRAILLTGTPSLSRPFDIFTQVDALSPGLLGLNKFVYASNYCEKRVVKMGNGHSANIYSGGRRLGELNYLLNQTIMIRRRKEDVLKELPPKRRQVLYFMPEQKHLKSILRHATIQPLPQSHSHSQDSGKEGASPPRKRRLPSSIISQISGHTIDLFDKQNIYEGKTIGEYHKTGLMKCSPVCEWLVSALRNSSQRTKFLIFGHHIDVLDYIQSKALEGNSDYVRIDGSTPSLVRQEYVTKFNSTPSVRCALLSLTAAGVGLDFSSAQIVVFAELPKEVSILEQAEARVHRKGQSFPVNIYFMCAKDTIDERLWLRLGTSLNKLKMVHDGQVAKAFSESHAAYLSESSSKHFDSPRLAPVANTRASAERLGKEVESNQRQQEDSRSTPAEMESFQMEQGTGIVPFFEISKYTDRIHLHLASDGTSPLGLNLTFEEIEPLLGQVCSQSSTAINVRSTFHLLRQFREEWNALRAYDRLVLRSKVLELPLNLQNYVKNETNHCTDRHLPLERLAARLPDGAEYKEAVVGDNNPVEVPFSSTGDRLCALCMHVLNHIVPNKKNIESKGVLGFTSKRDLFCSRDCYDKASLCSSGTYARRKLRDIEKGVCQMCGLDCVKLVVALRAVKVPGRAGPDQEASMKERSDILSRYSEKFFLRGFKVVRDRLLRQPIEGNAWQADHILAVFQGGGCSGLGNLRTLCVCCHKEVTAEQAKVRARGKREKRNEEEGKNNNNIQTHHSVSVKRKRKKKNEGIACLKRAPRTRDKFISSDSDSEG